MDERGILDQESFRIGVALGMRAGVAIVQEWRLDIAAPLYRAMMGKFQDCINRAEGKDVQRSAVVDGEAEIASWLPTPADIEIASWTMPTPDTRDG